MWKVAVVLAAALMASTSPADGKSMLGFDLDGALVLPEDIHRGGPARDGIPSIDKPDFISVGKVKFLKKDDLVISFAYEGVIRAYPLRILAQHEVVNDSIGDLHFSVTYCPLCGTGMVFDRTIDGEPTTFGVSGLLYQSDVLLYDRTSESLWSQLMMKAISGPQRDSSLNWLASEFMTWSSWKAAHPDGQVLSTRTGHVRAYHRDQYAGYAKQKGVMFPVPLYRDNLRTKALILGIILNDQATAYDLDFLESGKVYHDSIGEQVIRLTFDSQTRHAQVTETTTGEAIPHVYAYWFAWQAFYPDTRLITHQAPGKTAD